MHKNTTIMQHNKDNTETNTEQDTENSTHISHAQDNAQPQHTCSAHNYRTYSLDYYKEFAYINNSNTIELYTISKENI